MKMCKYLNQRQVQWVPCCIVDGQLSIANPSENTLVRLGYMPFVDSAQGEDEPGMVQVAHYSVKDGVVFRCWIYEKEESL